MGKVYPPILRKVEAVAKWPTPQTVYDVRSFLGFVGCSRRFIKNFSKIAKPIRDVITGLENQSKRSAKKTFVEWTEAADSAFGHLKKYVLVLLFWHILITSCLLSCILTVVQKD